MARRQIWVSGPSHLQGHLRLEPEPAHAVGALRPHGHPTLDPLDGVSSDCVSGSVEVVSRQGSK